MSGRYQSGCLYRENERLIRMFGSSAIVMGRAIGRKSSVPWRSSQRSKTAMKACEPLRANMNRGTQSPRTVAELVAHYKEKELPEDSNKAFSTRKAYQCYFKNWIVPVWGERRLSAVKTVAVEDWLRTLSLAPGTKAKLRNIMSAVFTHAIRHE